MLKMSQVKLPVDIKEDALESRLKVKIAKTLNIKETDISNFSILKRSIDARKKPDIFYTYSVVFSLKDETAFLKKIKNKKLLSDLEKYENKKYVFPYVAKGNSEFVRPIIIGTGPAGLFCGLFLSRAGFKPIIFERGSCIEKRSEIVEKFWKDGVLDSSCNVQFGEGGAGTFSDGKLNTLIKDPNGINRVVLETFTEFGAPKRILYDAKPHIGTDILKDVVKNIREEIIRLGGEIHFDTLVSEICFNNGSVTGVKADGQYIKGSNVVLAIGHSARDTVKTLYDSGVFMEQKPFSVGFRVQHPQKMINLSRYGSEDSQIGAADYKVTAKTDSGRGVFSFCMCPGGYVVNASSEEGMLAVNGMSYSKRDGENANSAIIFTVDSSDYPSSHPLAGIEFQRDIERKAYLAGGGAVPIQYYGEFKSKVTKEDVLIDQSDKVSPMIKGKYAFGDLTGIFTDNMNESFIQGMEHFGKIIPGFSASGALLAGVESRTSSPVRITRNEYLESNMEGLFPCGEGAGYAGGITSAAADGIKVAQQVAKILSGL